MGRVSIQTFYDPRSQIFFYFGISIFFLIYVMDGYERNHELVDAGNVMINHSFGLNPSCSVTD